MLHIQVLLMKRPQLYPKHILCLVLEQDIFTTKSTQEVGWLRPDITETLLTGTLHVNFNQNCVLPCGDMQYAM